MSSSSKRLPVSFWWLNATQFCGALNDNLFKLLAIFFAISLLGKAEAGKMVAIGGAVFVLPFLLLTPLAGVLADRFSKRTIIFWTRCLEIVVMLVAVWGYASGSLVVVFASLFLMASQSALFSPSKYGIVPELVGSENLSRANSLLVAMTFLAIIVGTGVTPLLIEGAKNHYDHAALVCVGVALCGALAAWRIPKTPPAGSTSTASLLFVRDIWRTLYSLRTDRYLLLAVMASGFFYMVGAFLQLNLIPYGWEYLGLDEEASAYLFLLAALGIGAGSVIAGKVSGRHIEFGIVPLGALGLTVSILALNWIPARLGCACVVVGLAGLSAGLFIVPIEAFIQFASPDAQRGRVLAASGFLGWIGVLLASGLIGMGAVLKLWAAQGFVIVGLLTLVLTVLTLRVLPDFFVRFILLLVTRLFYRIRVTGDEQVPLRGGALLVSNHVSYVDALLIGATQPRRIRFLMDRSIYEKSGLKRFLELMGVIPISMTDPPRRILASLEAARQALDNGYLVCIFAEGALTRTGLIHQFKSGLERIVRKTAAPIIPVYIGGAWGSIFSHFNGPVLSRLPSRIPYPVSIRFGKPLPPTSSAFEVRQAVTELSCETFREWKASRRTLAEAFIRSARRHWRRPAMSDTLGRRLTFGQTLASAFALAEEIRKESGDQKTLGLLLPSSVGGALANLAVALLGRVSVNLNFTVSPEAYKSALAQAEIRTILTSRRFIEKVAPLKDIGRLVFIEDLAARIGSSARVKALLKALFLPAARAGPARHSSQSDGGRGASADDVATIIFSSGTTGEPKGVMLSHRNLLSNVEALRLVFRPAKTDNLCAILPFFHSFGLTACLWFPLLNGMAANFHTSPLDGQTIAGLVRENRCTLLFTTPTFLLAYLRRATREDFATLRLVITGAEKLKARVADAFEEKFGVRPFEGYGATELSPVAALNLPDAEQGGVRQQGHREGSVGRPIPGVAAKIVDPETGAVLPAGRPGLLLIKGPNVMAGYLKRPDLTAQVMRDDWYVTGDIACLDEDGFLTITDRQSRFSKIGGEMVPHLAIEEELQRELKKTEPVVAVTAVPDEKRGERLVVLYTASAGEPTGLRAIMEKSAVSNLWKPGKDSYYRIDAIPLTGSGKLDVKSLRELAKKLAGTPEE